MFDPPSDLPPSATQLSATKTRRKKEAEAQITMMMITNKKPASSRRLISVTIYHIPNTLRPARLLAQQIAQTQISSPEPILDLTAATGQNGDGRTLEFLLWGWMVLKSALKLVPSYHLLQG